MFFETSRAHVSLSNITGFHESVNDFAQMAESASSDMVSAVRDLAEEIEALRDQLEKQTKECESIYSEVQKKKSEIEHNISALRNRLRNTPKKLEQTVTAKDGSKKVVSKPNPEYAAIESQIHKENARLSQIKELSWAVYNKKSEIRREAEYVAGAVNSIRNSESQISSSVNHLINISHNADRSLERTEEAVEQYISTTIFR